MLAKWDSERLAVREGAQVVLDGPGRLKLRRAAVNRAGEQLVDWADGWRPYLPAIPTDPQQIARLADRSDDRPRLWTAFDSYARGHAEHAHPEHAPLRATAATDQENHRHAGAAVAAARRQHEDRLARFGALAWTPDPAERLADTDRDIAATHTELAAVRARISRLMAEPALLAQPADRLVHERDPWRADQDADPTTTPIGRFRCWPPPSRVSCSPRPEDLAALTRRTPLVQASGDEICPCRHAAEAVACAVLGNRSGRRADDGAFAVTAFQSVDGAQTAVRSEGQGARRWRR